MKLWLLASLIVGIAINSFSLAKPIKETGKFSVYVDLKALKSSMIKTFYMKQKKIS